MLKRSPSKSAIFLLAGVALFRTAFATDSAPAPNLYDLMKNVVAVQTQIIWDVGNNAQDEKGDPDPAKVNAADWIKVAGAAGKVKAAAETLARAAQVVAAAPGQKIDGEGSTPGAFGAKQVQHAIDSNPKIFQQFARELSATMGEIEMAAKAKDARKLFDISGRLDQECEGCHKQFWYPDQKAFK